MIRSMTGFVEKEFTFKTLSAKISIKTLNHRFLDWSFRGTYVRDIENRIRALCNKKLYRGRIEIFIDLTFSDAKGWDIIVNDDLLLKILSSFKKISSDMANKISFPIENLFAIPHVMELRRKSFSGEEAAFLERAFKKTLHELIKERMREGRKLAGELRSHVQNLRRIMIRLEKLARKQPVVIQEKMRERLKELSCETSLSDDKLLQEAAYMAQKYDLTEEIARLKFHLSSVRDLISSKTEGPVGKKLDFTVQELMREANTIGSKSQNIEITREILAVKGELESIRQQVQNIE